MTPELRTKLRNMLINDEGFRQFPYVDTTNHLSIGIGRNLTDRGINFQEASLMLDDDIIYFTTKLQQSLPFFHNLSEARQIVLINMCFNLGVQGFLAFQEMIKALEKEDYNDAANQIIASEAARQLPERYHRLSYIMRSNIL